MRPEYEKAWLSDDTNRRELSNLLNNPVMLSAINILEGRGRPAKKLITAPADAALTHNALEAARLTGYHQFLDDLFGLLNKPNNQQQIPEEEPYMEHAVQDLRARGLEPKNIKP